MAHFWESGFVVREQAWHGLATVLDKAPTTAEALRQSQLDWHVNLTPVFAMPGMAPELAEKNGIAAAPLSDALYCDDARAMVREIHQRDGTLRSDVLGMVGTRYCPLQNTDAFRWFDPLCADGSVELESAGSVKGGRHVWILARIATKPLQVGRKPEDVATPYLLLSNSHDGSRAVTVAFTPIRVVCWNTLSAANRQADKRGASSRKVRHTQAAANTLAGVRETISLEARNFEAKALLWRELAKTDVARPYSQELARQVSRFARIVFGSPATVAKHKAEGTLAELPEVRAESHLWELVHKGPGADSAGVSPFGLYMAATHYSDHFNGHTAETRLASTWFGAGAQVRERAEVEALELAGMGAA
jgi:phage/plasmid-like protein (TIGR03299 family)